MYFSKIQLNGNTNNVQLTFITCKNSELSYLTHQLMWSLFPNNLNERCFVYRSDNLQTKPIFYMISTQRPQNNGGFILETKDYNPKLFVGQELFLSLRANPMVRNTNNGKLYDIIINTQTTAKYRNSSVSEQIKIVNDNLKQWLMKRAEPNGFIIKPEHISIDNNLRNKIIKYKFNFKFNSIDYYSKIYVYDVKLFKNFLFTGLGRSKSFGCGLALIKNV